MSKNQSKFLILSLAGIVLLILGQFFASFRNNILLFLAIIVIILFKIKTRWLYFASLSLSIILPFFLFFFPDEKVGEYLGNFIYFFLLFGILKQIFALGFKDD